MTFTRFVGSLTILLTLPAPSDGAAAPSDARDKDGYTILRPTPRELWRELSADRPDVTESPISVDAGAVQIEASFIEWARNGSDELLSVAPINFKLGLTNRIDLQLAWDGWLRRHDDDGAAEGAGDLAVRMKINLWGNDPDPTVTSEHATALGVMPFIKLPTASDDLGNGKVEGGLIVPFSIELAEGLGLGLMVEADAVYDEDDDDYDLDLVHTASIGVDVTERMGAYVEYVGVAGAADYRTLLSLGVTFALTDNLVLDAGVNVGLLGDVDDVRLFTGMTIRF